MISFTKKKVLITAGASGIGRAIAQKYLHAGADVHVVDVDSVALEKFKSDCPEVHTSQLDVAHENSVIELFEKQSGLGGLHILVNCAGIKGPTDYVESMDYNEWSRCIAVNLDATFLCCKGAIPLLKASAKPEDRSSIINISSTAGWHGYPMRSPYAAAKWAVIGFTKSLAMELGTEGVRVNVICPGTVDGERMDRVISDEAALKGVSEEVIRQGYAKGCSLREMMSAEDIADMALFLSSNQASKVTGQIMNVDGHLERFAVSD